MSGLVALLAPTSDQMARSARLTGLTRILKHRGPDQQHEWWDTQAGLGLGFRRLSILDLSRDATQPMVSVSRRYVVMIDGTIANHIALRDELMMAGVVFRMRSDAEILLASIEKWGLNAALQKLNGGFAIFLWDTLKRQLHLIRDHFGQKPIYFGWVGHDFLCASDLHVFRNHPEFNAVPDSDAVALYLRLGSVPPPYTIWRGIAAMLPGSRLMIETNRLRVGLDLRSNIEQYWQPAKIIEDARTHGQNRPDTPGEFEGMFQSIVRNDLIADSNVTLHLDGTVGSVFMAQAVHKCQPAALLSVGFAIAAKGQPPDAGKACAEHLGFRHETQTIRAEDYVQSTFDFIDQMDQPFDHPDGIKHFLIGRTLKDRGGVLLDAIGWDVLLDHQRAQNRARQLQIMIRGPGLFGLWRGRTSRLVPSLDDAYEDMMGGQVHVPCLVPRQDISGYPFRLSTWWPTGLDMAQWVKVADLIHDLPVCGLAGLDRAVMASGIEPRFSFLRPEILRYIWSHPQSKQLMKVPFLRPVPGVVALPTDFLSSFPGDTVDQIFLQHSALTVFEIDDEKLKKSGVRARWRVFILLRWWQNQKRS